MTRGARMVAAVAVVVALMATAVMAVRASYGAFTGGYTLLAKFDRATYGFGPNTEIDYLGVDVGHVSHVVLLPDHRAQASLVVDPGFAVPAGTRAEVHDRSLFGDPFVALVFPPSPGARDLVAGDRIQATSVDADTADLITHATPLLQHINGGDLLTLITELDQATQGEGGRIAAAIHAGAQLSGLFADTINAQVKALNSFTAFQSAITPDAGPINTLAAEANRALPTLNAAEADFQQALATLEPFAARLANIIAQERPDIDKLLSSGDNVVRLLAMREPQIEQVVSGLALYLQKFAQASGPETLPNGTEFAYFKNFIELSDIRQLICGLVDPTQGSALPAQLQTIVSALSGTALACNARAAAVSASSSTSGGSGALPPAARAAAQDLINRVAAQVGAPEVPRTETVGDLVNHILGRSP